MTMNTPIVVMKRYELKYILDAGQTEYLTERLCGHMREDDYGLTPIASLYYDTPDARLIRTSVEKPEFKEKIRLRSYGLATQDSPVFLELKRKAYGVVYKRRVQSVIPTVESFFRGERDGFEGGQIDRELLYFREYYRNLEPTCLILYDRTAYYEPDGDLRLTIDRNPRYRTEDLRLDASMDGAPLLGPGEAILELKIQQAIPLWLTDILACGSIRQGSISKYGEVYKRRLLPGA